MIIKTTVFGGSFPVQACNSRSVEDPSRYQKGTILWYFCASHKGRDHEGHPLVVC